MENKVAAITGAYGGLGAALARGLAKRGYKLILGGRNKTELERFAEELSSITKAVPISMDVRNKRDCQRFANAAVKNFGRLDVLINNAGIWKMLKIEDATERDIMDMFETNAIGPIFCAKAAVSIMKKQGSGHIINIGSAVVVDYESGNVAYGASKAALVGFTGCLKKELQGTGIRVTAVSPDNMKPPDRLRSSSTDHMRVAEIVIGQIEKPSDEWHIVLKQS